VGRLQAGAPAGVWLLPRPVGVDYWRAAGPAGNTVVVQRWSLEVRIGLRVAQLCPSSPALSPRVWAVRRLASLQSSLEAASRLWVVYRVSPEEASPLPWATSPGPSAVPLWGRGRPAEWGAHSTACQARQQGLRHERRSRNLHWRLPSLWGRAAVSGISACRQSSRGQHRVTPRFRDGRRDCDRGGGVGQLPATLKKVCLSHHAISLTIWRLQKTSVADETLAIISATCARNR
jgi:hypothetical protein